MEYDLYKAIYKIENNDNSNSIRIIGEDFVKNNKNKGLLIINNKKVSLKSMMSINNIKDIKIKIILNKNISNKSCLFKNCQKLESISYLSSDNNIENIQEEENIIRKKENLYENNDEYFDNSLLNISRSESNHLLDNYTTTKNTTSHIEFLSTIINKKKKIKF